MAFFLDLRVAILAGFLSPPSKYMPKSGDIYEFSTGTKLCSQNELFCIDKHLIIILLINY